MIFSRGRKRLGRHSRGEGPRHSRPPAGRPGDEFDDLADADTDADTDTDADEDAGVPARGPYDVTEAPADVARLDLGSLRIPAVDGVEIRVQANPDGAIQQVVLVHGDNALQLGVFAAPRTEGIWDEVRDEIRKSLLNEGGAAEEIGGECGIELRARVRAPEGMTDLRFVGIDGPRWMVRGVYQGGAATDPAKAGLLDQCLRGLVVVRGQEAKPVREPLPLRLPREVAEQAARQPAGAGGPDGEGAQQAEGQVNGAAPGEEERRRPSPRPRRT